MNKRRIYTATACFVSLCGAMYGQTGEKTASFQYFVTNDVPGAVSIRVDGMGGKTVKDKPFSATEERETLQVLGDGTRIDKKETDKYFRDAQGRTRIERNDGATVTITDPVAGFSTEMSTGSKTARRMVQMRTTNGAFSTSASPQMVMIDKLKAEAQAVATLKTDAQAFDKLKAEMEVSGRTTELHGVATSNMVYTKTAGGPVEGEKPVTEDLGTQMINGISATGTRTTITIPAGQIGNDREIRVVSERWFSPDLQMLIKSSNKDPRFGETTYQLTNVLQGSQDPTLFQIPSDFSVTGLRQ